MGEIFQYTVEAAPGYEEEHDIADLRTIQDWYIVPQLLGTKGVAEVNTLGGILKEYEVAVDPGKLNSMGITMAEIFTALTRNNENTGGAYIDKQPYAYFIRSIGLVSSLEDVSKIVIKNSNNIPILIRDVAEVRYGSAIRYGATTKDGKGEVVNGMVMMLKGENSAEVVRLVKERMAQIIPTLPEGIIVSPYLDRSKLVNRAINTVRTNLLEGALIVIFILVLLIGNWRAGLIVASVIPLSLLFAVTMMRVFGVSGNLMSLGAIDFGLIVDGAVIIVEAIVHRLQSRPTTHIMSAEEMDREVGVAASQIRKSAAFGEIIILIVYLPILALVGIEGKMFVPMAQTVSFAILGAFILSLTYVPMMSALTLSRSLSNRETLSDRIIAFFQKLYSPVLNLALRFKIIFLIGAVALFIAALLLFRQLGGEFIPVLKEGDIATHIIIPPGSSLEQEIATNTKAERILKQRFPEIEMLVSKIGSAEVPTDPMPMYLSDLMIILKDKNEWVSATSHDELIQLIEDELDQLPGVTTEFSQPVQMRFNELMTGIRSDVGIKIYGEDLEQLVAYSEEVVQTISVIEGVEDVRAETVTGLPQIVVEYDKDKLALYGLNVQGMNRVISMGFAGRKAGVVYEGEKSYDLVVRLAEPFRKDIEHLKNLYVHLPSGSQIPLEQVASVEFRDGPAQISRENGKRRIIIGFNVRNRDVESAVSEIQQSLSTEVDLPPGYYFEYAGQFENLKTAQARLAVAVPIALSLIFIMLFFTFGSIIQSLLIFTAIPLSAVGGVAALYLRGMPFSISAGIGFIALFGVAVLNGIVLIGYFNQLKKDGMTNVLERIKVGTSVRLRPVIMTAAVASLGFLPMALSTSAGAEVQKPLATVVIGGLITATLLTLVILPILYYYTEKAIVRIGGLKTSSALILVLFFSFQVDAQSRIATVDDVLEIARKNNKDVQASLLQVDQFSKLEKAAYIPSKTNISVGVGQFNSRLIDQSYSISQKLSPSTIKAKKAKAKIEFTGAEIEHRMTLAELEWKLKNEWCALLYKLNMQNLLKQQLDLWGALLEQTELSIEIGSSSILERNSIQLSLENVSKAYSFNDMSLDQSLNVVKLLAGTEESINAEHEEFLKLEISRLLTESFQSGHPLLDKNENDIQLASSELDLLISKRKPDIELGYTLLSIQGVQNIEGELRNYNGIPRFHVFHLGLNVPIFGKNFKAQKEAAHGGIEVVKKKREQLERQIAVEIVNLKEELEFLLKLKKNYEDNILVSSAQIVQDTRAAYEAGDVPYITLSYAYDKNLELQKEYLASILKLWQVKNAMEYYINDK